jgi:hypothetical protein
MHIVYEMKKGHEYAKVCTSTRIGKKVTKECTTLGRVLDKESGIFQNRERGVFTFELETNTYGRPPASFIQPAKGLEKEKLILDFGDAFALDKFIMGSGLGPAIDAIGYGNPDTLKAMVSYYILCHKANWHANDWWEQSYARELYPKANLTSQRISEFLRDIGEEESMRGYFGVYIPSLGGTKKGANILIDSTGLPNNIHFPLTAVSNHNGEISNEVRLIYVTHQESGLPIFFRYCPGNVVDVSTLIRTIRELKSLGVNVRLAILDAGYYSDDNFKELYAEKIAFVTRMKENRKLYKYLVATHIPGIESEKNIVEYNGRYVYITRVSCELLDGCKAYAYVGLDIDRKASEAKKLFARAKAEGLSAAEVYKRLSNQGRFILVSSKRLATDEILPFYYTRQQIEQVFDIGKNYTNMIPLRVQNENTFRGHLMLTFIATTILKKLQDRLTNTSYDPVSLLWNMRSQKCKVYEKRILTLEPVKKQNDGYKLLGIECPVEIPRLTRD